MNAPRYIVKNAFQQFQQELDNRSHRKKLSQIKSKKACDTSITDGVTEGIHQKQKHQMYFLKQQMEKLNVINKENEQLLEKLVNINKGKNKKAQDALDDNSSSVFQKKLLFNEINRKIENQRIQKENTLIVKRLVERIQSNERSSKQQRTRAISEYLDHRKHLQKLNSYQANPSGIKLPPILSEQSHQEQRNKSEDKKEQVIYSASCNPLSEQCNDNTLQKLILQRPRQRIKTEPQKLDTLKDDVVTDEQEEESQRLRTQDHDQPQQNKTNNSTLKTNCSKSTGREDQVGYSPLESAKRTPSSNQISPRTGAQKLFKSRKIVNEQNQNQEIVLKKSPLIEDNTIQEEKPYIFYNDN